jgi:predicted NUDIX family NTP pyrophosphohydrolase
MVPKVDRARWFGLDDARAHMLASQAGLLDCLEASSPTSSPIQNDLTGPRR